MKYIIITITFLSVMASENPDAATINEFGLRVAKEKVQDLTFLESKNKHTIKVFQEKDSLLARQYAERANQNVVKNIKVLMPGDYLLNVKIDTVYQPKK